MSGRGAGRRSADRGARSRQAGRGVRLAVGARPRPSATVRPRRAPTSTRRSTTASCARPTRPLRLAGRQAIDRDAVSRLTALTGDAGTRPSVLFEQGVLNAEQPVDPTDVVSAERAVRAASFGGSRHGVLAALRQAKLTIADARAIIVARLQRDLIQARFQPPAATPAQIADFLTTYANQPVRLVRATEKAPWLGGAAQGWAVSSLAPAGVFTLTGEGAIDTTDGSFTVTPLGPVLPLGLVPRSQAHAAAKAALGRLAREKLYRSWLHAQELKRLR